MRFRHIVLIFILLLLSGVVNEVWAAKVTYHILTLPIDNTIYSMNSGVNGYRLEAIKVVIDNQASVELPAHYKSPLATGFTYYNPSDITIGSTVQIYANNSKTKGTLYDVKDGATPVAEGTVIEGTTAEYYVVYTYNSSNTIANLDGLSRYNIGIKNKGFLALNRGRNNRPAVVPKAKVDAEMLASKDFMKVESPGAGITTYWNGGNDNKNKEADVGSQFHFIFQFEGKDPYNIIIRNSYNRNITYIEKNDDTKEFVYKWYKGGSLFGVGNANNYIASDDHKKYNIIYNTSTYPTNPTNLEEGEGQGYNTREGNFHGQTGTIWGSFALLNNTTNDGYVFMGTRTVDGNGVVPTPGSDNKYYYLKFDNNNLTINKLTAADATKSYSTEGKIYKIATINFHVTTPFYPGNGTNEDKAAHTLTASIEMSEYTMASASISDNDVPASLKRKYCNITGYYKNAALTESITKYADLGEATDIYIGYEVLPEIPFKTVAAADTTWYELTDAGSIQEYSTKIKYDGSANFNNNGASGSYEKTSEFAFIGDPYELKIIHRSLTWKTQDGVSYVGVESPFTSGTALTASESATEGYLWEIPDDATNGSFLLRKFKGTGYWNWDTGHSSKDITYNGTTQSYNVPNSNAQTVTLNISGLTVATDNYITVTAKSGDTGQVIATTPTLSTGIGDVSSDGKATVTVMIKGRGDSNKTFTLTVTEYDSEHHVVGTATDITINQNVATAYAGSAVAYSTEGSTRIKVLPLPTCTYTYKIVDKSGRIAVKASTSQTIFSPLSLASIPSIIVSPYLVGETVTFYSTYTSPSNSRTLLADEIIETPDTNHDIYVKYTTISLDSKPIKLSEDQQLYVKLNGKYIYYNKNTKKIESSDSPQETDAYRWVLRNRDPYAMLIDNLGARADQTPAVTGREEVVVYDDDGGTTTLTRDKGAWVKLNAALGNDVALAFTIERADAQRFIAKLSNQAGVYEVMVATGDGEGTPDASTTYYNIGRPADHTIKIYKQDSYVHGHEVLKFELEANAVITYHLIDKSKKDLIQVTNRSLDLNLPSEYVSPLVSTYHYWQASAFVDANPEGGTDFNFTGSPVEIASVAELTDAKYETPVESDVTHWENAASGGKQMTATTEDNMIAQVKLIQAAPATYEFRIGSNPYTYKSVYVSEGHKTNADIYVTYDTDEHVGFGTKSPYVLKFLHGKSYYMEDGNDKLTTEKMQAMYPYCNGDGQLNIYGEKSNEEQMSGGSSTRPRWIWFLESDSRDPYHVKIHSRSTISFNGNNNSTYLQTYAVHFNQDNDANTRHIVTGGNLAGISQVSATEYMILGEIQGGVKKYKLLTTNPVAIDLNGDGDTNDEGESAGERQYVRSFEQYWKTYNMLKQHVLGISKEEDEFSENPETFVMPSSKWSELKTKLGSGEGNLDINDSEDLNYVDNCSWHSYSTVANAQRWNGFDDKGKASKKVEELEHWFQTFDMGDGTFEIESADIPPVLVLLDRHGWEIMRKTLPTTPDQEKIAALKAYDSPMVKEYKFYNNATKAVGCHKYTLRLNDKGEERDQIKVGGKHFTSTSLGTLPAMKADQYGTYSDVYVTYTVKEEYEKSYTYDLTTDTSNPENPTYTETGTPSKFVVILNARYARNKIKDTEHDSYLSKPVFQGTSPTGGNVYDMILNPSQVTMGNVKVDADGDGKIDNNNLWYVQPNLEIDDEMGIPWASQSGGSNEPLTKYETKVKYKDQTGFDPYNIQLKNVQENKFFTMDLSSTRLENGIWVGTLASDGITLQAQTTSGFVTPEGYDHTTLKITKQTFMAVSDAKGNMQLMPRFDHTKRVEIETGSPFHTKLKDPEDHSKVAVVTDNSSMGPQTVFMVRPQVLDYRIIDNDGNEALRYRNAGEYSPSILAKFRSPLATDFKYYYGYTTNTITEGSFATDWENATELYKRTATTDNVATQAKLLPATGDYYFRIGTDPEHYTYKKVSVTEVKEITTTFAEAGVESDAPTIYVRYSYNASADDDDNDILQGKWFTMNLAGKDVQSNGTINTLDGTGVSFYSGTKPDESDETPANRLSAKTEWHWKFVASPTDISSPYYRPVDPYAVQIFNRKANYSNNLNANPNPMSIGIKVSDGGGTPNYYDHFAILSHPNGGYALVVTGLEIYSYSYLNGANMTIPSSIAASIVEEIYQKSINLSDYATEKGNLSKDGIYYFKLNGAEVHIQPTYKKVTRSGGTITTEEDSNAEDWGKSYISPGAQLILNDDVEHNYQYNVITNENIVEEVNYGSKLAIRGTQDKAAAGLHNYVPYLPENMQTRLLNEDDYLYYGGAIITDAATPTPSDPYDDTYTMVDATKLITLHGLYDDVVYVRYKPYSMDETPYNAPNKKAVVAGKVAKDPTSQDVAININDGLPYNIIWEDDNMMKANNGAIECTASQDLSGDVNYTWQFAGNDPYALQIKNKGGKFINNSSDEICTLENTATPFMLLNKDGYDYGVLQKTGDASANMLTFGDHDGKGGTAETLYLSTSNPKYFIIFGLSTHKLLYHLIINTTKEITPIPYRAGNEKTYDGTVAWAETDTIHIKGTTQRDLISMRYGIPGDKYQLGSTIMGQTYSVDAGEVSIGDVLAVPEEFKRPNCNFFFYIDNIQKAGAVKYQKGGSNNITSEDAMRTDADALTEIGDYYYKISGGNIYRKVHVSSVSPSVVYEVSGSTKAAYDAAATSNAFQRTATSFDDMKTNAANITIWGDHYYKINDGASYFRFTKYPTAVNNGADTTFVVCTATDWTNAVAAKVELAVASEAAMETAASSLASVGDYYYEIGPLDLYKKVHVTTAKVAETPAAYTDVDCTEEDWTYVWQDYPDLNNKYKGLKLPVQSPRLMSDAALIGCLVKVNVAYAFQTGLETNAGEGFVTSVDQNLWYTFETYDKEEKKSYLAHYTNAWGLQSLEGRDTRYTNDYLWTPLGDVYGFRMYNRYMIKNSGGVNNVMTMPSISEGQNLMLHLPDAEYTVGNEIFELLLSNTSGSFRIHPVINDTGTKYYIRRNPSDNYAKLSTTATEWTFALGSELLMPYIDRVGYVGGLTESAYTAHKTDLDKVKDGTANYTDLLNIQKIVYDDDNIVKYAPGYYRLHSQPGVSDISPVRYASGYLHETEKTAGTGSTAIPMHFYSRKGTNTTFETLENGFTYTNATRGPIPVPATEYDPSTIFYFNGPAVVSGNPTSTMQTQGLYVAENGGNGLGTNREKRAVMVATANPANDALILTLMDIGGAVLLIHDGAVPADRKYLNFDQSNFFQRTATDVADMNAKAAQLTSTGTYYFKVGSSTYKKVTVTTPKNGETPAVCDPASNGAESNETNWERAADIYDLKYYHDSPTDDAKWCMAPADSLLVETHSGGDGYFYSTFCAPYDMKLPENKENNTTYYAYICTEWNTKSIHPVKTGGGGKEIPAGTPVIIRTKDTSGSVKLTFPTTPLSSAGTNIFTGKYLEQLLATEITAEDKVYSFGLPITGYGIVTTSGATNGDITDVINKSQDYTGVGFYINANPNKELSEETGQWYPNNRYVLHNKIYYRAGEDSGASAPQRRAPEFVPVIFDDEEGDEELNPDGSREVIGDGCVYDLMGRKVATREQVEDGSWKQRVATGIYIINGKKIRR